MDIATTCPQCQFELRLAPEARSQPQVCPRCQHTFVPGALEAPTEAARAYRPGPSTIDGNALLTALLALLPTAAVYAACVYGPQDSQVIQIVRSGKWVNVVSVYFASWAAILLLFKRAASSHQRQALGLDLVPYEIDERITPSTAARFARHAEDLEARMPGTFAIKRVVKTLRFFQSGRSPQETASYMRAFADVDGQLVESSYMFVKVLVWAIPIMGFIGTVLGIGESVNGFSETMQGAQQLEVIRTSLGNVTTGLAVAFNTTLVALVLSLLVMFPMSALQRADERLLGDIDDYLDERLLRRLQSDKDEQSRGLELIRDSLAEQAQVRQAELAELRQSIDAAVRGMGDRVLEAWSVVDQRLERRERVAHERAQTLVAAFDSSSRGFFDELIANAKSRTEEAQNLIGQMAAVGERIEADAVRTFGVQSDMGRQALLEAQQAIIALRERDQAEHKEIVRALSGSAQEIERVSAELARDTSGSASAIGELIGDLSRKMLAESQAAIASLRDRDRDEYREIVKSLQGSAQEMERATAALAREASGSASQIVSVVSELSRKAAMEAQQAVTSLRERDREEQKEIARTIQRAAQEMERATTTLAKEASGSTTQLTAMFRQLNIGLEGQAKTLAASLATQLERQMRELSALQRGLSDGLATFQSSLRTLESELGSTIRDTRERADQDEKRNQEQVADAWATARQTIEASTRAFETHASSTTASMRELVDAQKALVAAVTTQFAGALAEHREALNRSSTRELGAVVKECKNIVAALGRATEPRERRAAAPRVASTEPQSDGDGADVERPRPVQSPRAELPRKALQPRTAKPRPESGASEPKPDRSGFWRRFWLGS